MIDEINKEEYKNVDDNNNTDDEKIIIEQFNDSDWFDEVKKDKKSPHKKNKYHIKQKNKLDIKNSKICIEETKNNKMNENLVQSDFINDNFFTKCNFKKKIIEEEQNDNFIQIKKLKNLNKKDKISKFRKNVPRLFFNENNEPNQNQLFSQRLFSNKLKKKYSISKFQNNNIHKYNYFDDDISIHKKNNELILPSKLIYKNHFKFNNSNHQNIDNNYDSPKKKMENIFHNKLFRTNSFRQFSNNSFQKFNNNQNNSYNNEISYCELPYVYDKKYEPYFFNEDNIFKNNNESLGNYKRNISGISGVYDIPKRTLKLKI